MTEPPIRRPSKMVGCTKLRCSATGRYCGKEFSSMMIPKTIVVDPTTAVPISTGFAVALFQLKLCAFEIRLKTELALDFCGDVWNRFNLAQFVNRLRIVRNRPEA